MIHLTTQQVSSYFDDELPDASMELVRLHLSACPACTGRFARMEAQEDVLARVLSHDPGEEFFECIVDDLFRERRRGPKRAGRAVLALERSSRALDAPGPQGRTAFWNAIVVIALLAGIGVAVKVRTSPGHRSLPARGVRALPAAGAAGRQGPGAGGAGALTILEGAARASANAGRAGTAAAYDEAADAWVRALPSLRGDADEEAAGRQELMDARYRAWTLDPNAARRAAAIEAVRSYLVMAPPDGQRDSAWSWLARLKR